MYHIIMNSHNFIELTGRVFGLLSVISQAQRLTAKVPLWNCICACGSETVVAGKHLRSGAIKSCGCLLKQRAAALNKTHGLTKSAEYKIWCGIKRRCYNVNEKCYPRYGGRGIKMSEDWRNSFAAFIADIGNRPSPLHSIDRINNNGNYEHGNCHWVSNEMQAKNRRSNVHLSCLGKSMTLSEWARLYKINPTTISTRLKLGWSVEKAITSPVRSSNKNPC